MAQIGNHSSGHLMLILGVVIFQRLADRKPFALGDISEMFRDRLQKLFIDERLITQRAQIFSDIEERRVR
jgi:hypothetical protein